MEVHQALKMNCTARSPKSQLKMRSLLKEIITSCDWAFKYFESDIGVGIYVPCNPTQETGKSTVILNQNANSQMLTLVRQANKAHSARHCMHMYEVVYKDILMGLTT